MKKKQKNKIRNIQTEKTNTTMFRLEITVLKIDMSKEEMHLKFKEKSKLSRKKQLIITILMKIMNRRTVKIIDYKK